jgi:hypothetical protein
MSRNRRTSLGHGPGCHPGHLLKVARLLYFFAALTVACAFLGAPNARAQASAHSEYEVKAAYLYNFGRFVQWSARATAALSEPFTICVLGEDPFGPILDATIAGESIDGRKVVAKRISGPQEALNCQILFIGSSEGDKLKEILTALDDASVLTVSDIPKFVSRGGMIQFILEDNKIRFEVNLTAAQRAGLTLSSQLLKLAVSVKRDPRPRG